MISGVSGVILGTEAASEDRVIYLPISWLTWKFMLSWKYPVPQRITQTPPLVKFVLEKKTIRIKFEKEQLDKKLAENKERISKALREIQEARTLILVEQQSDFSKMRLEAITKAEALLKEDLETTKTQSQNLEKDFALIEEDIKQLTLFYQEQFKIKAITDAFLTSEDFRKENEFLSQRLQAFSSSCDEISTKFKSIERDLTARGTAEVQVLSWRQT